MQKIDTILKQALSMANNDRHEIIFAAERYIVGQKLRKMSGKCIS